MEGRSKRSPKRNRHTGGKVAGGAVLLALLLAGGHFGLGIGREGGGLLMGQDLANAQQTVAQNMQSAKEATGEALEEAKETVTEAVEEILVPAEDGVLTITVKEDRILYEGREVTLPELEETLLQDFKADSTTVELRDDHAIKATYDEVRALLEKLSIPFTTGKQ